MAIKFFFLVILCSFSLTTFSQSKSQKRYISIGAKAHKNKKYAQSNAYLSRAYNFKNTKKIPPTVLYLYAVNLQKLGKHKNALYYFSKTIKKQYTRQHVKVLKALNADEIDGDRIPKLLKATYFYMAQSYYALFTERNDKRNAERAKKYFKICEDSGFNNRCGAFIENINEKLSYNTKDKKSFEFFLYGGRFMLNDRVTIKNDTTGANSDILSSTDAFCYGAGLRFQNAFEGWQVSGCAFSGFASVKGEIDSTEYKQLGVPIAGLYVDGGYYWRTDSEKTRIGISLPTMYRSGLYSEPTGYSIGKSKNISYGLALSTGFQFPYVELEIKLANMQDSNLAMTNLVFNF